MESMSMSISNKTINVIKCYFCSNAKFDDEFSCAASLPISDECKKFLRVEDVSLRIDEIFEKLPGE